MGAHTSHASVSSQAPSDDAMSQPDNSSGVRLFLARYVITWIRDNSFPAASVKGNRWSRVIGYALALVIPGLIAVADLLLTRIVPEAMLFGLLEILAVALIAIGWGAGPALLATLAGGALLNVAVIPSVAQGGNGPHAVVADTVLYAITGITIAIAVSRQERLRREAQAARASMQRFVSVVSHELRQPMTSLLMALQLGQKRARTMAGGESLTPECVRSLQQLESLLQSSQRQVTFMNRLIDDLLEVSRIQTNRFTVTPAPADLATIVREAVEQRRLASSDREITLDLGGDGPLPVMADAQRIGQVLTNYLTNALKYSPADRPVAVNVRRDRAQVRVSVRDQGPGLPLAEQRLIWECFHRAEGIEAQEGDSSGGLGLGLHISKTIVEQHRGRVGVLSSPGHGSTFWFTLPLQVEPQSARPVLERMRSRRRA